MYMYYVCTSLLLLGPLLPLTSLPTSPCVPWLQLADSSLPASLSGGPGSMGWDGMGWAGLGLLQKDGQDERAPGQTGRRTDRHTVPGFLGRCIQGCRGPKSNPLSFWRPADRLTAHARSASRLHLPQQGSHSFAFPPKSKSASLPVCLSWKVKPIQLPRWSTRLPSHRRVVYSSPQ